MDKYNPESKCPKCGGDLVSTTYRGNHIERTCQRCHYEWYEKPLDEK